MNGCSVYFNGKFNEVKDIFIYKNGEFVKLSKLAYMYNGTWITLRESNE